MSCDKHNPYTLPTICFVGGETQDLAFNVFHSSRGQEYNLNACEANISIVSLMNKTGKPVLTKPMSTKFDKTGKVKNVLYVSLSPDETISLSGKYIYEIQMRDVDGDVEIPNQGFMYITNNINKSFIARGE